MEQIIENDLLDPENFVIWYDDLDELMTISFERNFLALKKKFSFLKDENIGTISIRGWLGVNEDYHVNGIISSMNVENLLKEFDVL